MTAEQAFEAEAGVREACGIVGVAMVETMAGDTLLVHDGAMAAARVIWADDGSFRVECTQIVPEGDSLAEVTEDRDGFTTYVGAALAALALLVSADATAAEHVEPWIRSYFEDSLPV